MHVSTRAITLQRTKLVLLKINDKREANVLDLGLSSDPTIQINSNEQSDLTNLTEPEITEVLDTFVENTVDAPAILKAIQTGLDAGCNAIQELEDFMNKFITKYAPKKKEKVNIRQLEEVTSDDSSANKICVP
ncbi:8718_t:CDS:2 [Cetraspora pellucida]|uniref:8718_t:CDS:1 n=1 Tax=Cetraspora pellucida TaxID=1433469 RepID=A0ACA9KMD5_9GLOM|nr:8718_t:CDS:2 [Cetraspora pellucida]